MSRNLTLASAFAAALLVAASASADPQTQLKSEAAGLIDLGNGASALTYWVDGADGRHVVTTIDLVSQDADHADRHQVVRVSAVLQDGQTQAISVPGIDAAGPAQVLRLHSHGDLVDVSREAAPAVQSAALK